MKEKQLEVAFFVSSFPVISETFIVNQIIALLQSGCKVNVFAKTRNNDTIVQPLVIKWKLNELVFYLDDYPQKRLQKMLLLVKSLLININRKNSSRIIRFFQQKSLQKRVSVYQLLPYLNKPEYDVVHAHFGINGNYVASLKTMGLFKSSVFITTFHGYDLELNKNIYDELFKIGNAFTVNSKYSKYKLVQLGCKENEIAILPVGLDTTFIKKNKVSIKHERMLTLLYVGRLVKFKGPDLFIKICIELKKRNSFSFKGIIIGDGELHDQLKTLIKDFSLEEMIELKGVQTQDRIIEYMNESDIFILPGITWEGRAENQGLVVQEAQAMELPVVVSDAGGMKEGIIDGETGFVVKEGDITDFADKVEVLARDGQLRKKMGERGRKFVEENYESSILCKQLLSLYCMQENQVN